MAQDSAYYIVASGLDPKIHAGRMGRTLAKARAEAHARYREHWKRYHEAMDQDIYRLASGRYEFVEVAETPDERASRIAGRQIIRGLR